ncbi:HAD-IB family hydrolase [Nocardia sp. BMG111209]|uniref:HAD-IB family hydrolase n=1 Tax=Nocardia sp. BMG111209 TaxID=1160137 RepID=UPI0003749E0D|nr:HAD-IB family hydrolase [Nocardia sp. BMG111209]
MSDNEFRRNGHPASTTHPGTAAAGPEAANGREADDHPASTTRSDTAPARRETANGPEADSRPASTTFSGAAAGEPEAAATGADADDHPASATTRTDSATTGPEAAPTGQGLLSTGCRPLALTDRIAAVRNGPQGPRIAAVFDFGGTVVHGLTPPPRWRRIGRDRRALEASLAAGIRGARAEGEYERFLQRAAQSWAGRTEAELDEAGARLFRSTLYEQLYPEAWQLIRTHEAAGHTLILASCLTRFQVLPVAAELDIPHVLYTRMAVEDGVLTGHVAGKPLWRTEKAEAVRRFAAAHDLDLPHSYAYADTITDLPLLELAGRPAAVDPDAGLSVQARERDWPTLSFRPRTKTGVRDIARTAAGFTALLTGAAAGIAGAAIFPAGRTTALDHPATTHTERGGTGSPRPEAASEPTVTSPGDTAGARRHQRMADAMIARAADATLRATGVRLRITGADYARAPRPAVFVFNHQSQFDIVVLAAVLRGGVTGIVKREITANPVFGPLLRFTGATFIDRSDTASAKAALAPVVETLRGGLSIAVAPEGTRSRSPRVGPFKKGAFHIAIQAGVPIVPVVIRNAGEIVRRDSMLVRHGTVEVVVLPPIDVGGWRPAAMNEDVERVRQLFVETLLDRPAPEGA